MSEFFGGAASTASTRVPAPRIRWSTRVALPAAILVAVVSLLAIAAWTIWAPVVEARGTPVVLAASIAPASDDQSSAAGAAPAGGATVLAAGWIEPRPFPVYATALTEGVVEQVLVLEGDRVTKGQLVATLVGADAEIGLARARADEARAEGMMTAAKATFDSLVERDAALATAIAKVAAAEASLASFDAEVRAAKAMLDELEDELARKRDLEAAGAVSALEIARLTFRAEAQRAAVAALPSRRSMLEAERDEAAAERLAAQRGRELLIEERAELAKAEAELASARAGVREAELRTSRTRIEAPIDGVVLARLVAPGMMVSTAAASVEGGRILSLYDPAELQVRADVPNADIALVGVGQAAEIKVEALPNATLRGEVLRITGSADIAKNTVQVKVRITNPPPELRPDMLCRVRILTGSSASGSTTAGASDASARQRVFALRSLIDGTRVSVAGGLRDGRGRAIHRTIELGREERGEWVEVLGGLSPGDVLLDPAIPHDARIHVTIDRHADGGSSS